MKNKGFTMVELLAVISLLAIVILIAVPTFGNVRDRTNQSIYESKIASVKASAEAYSEETGEIAFDVATLISQGKLEADNESGEYRNPVNGEDMRCYAVEVRYENLQYYANVHETSRCLSETELQDLYGTFKIQAFKNHDPLEPIHENWYNEPLKLGYELNKSELSSKIEQITWVGDRSITCTKEAGNLGDCEFYGEGLLGSAGSIQTMKVSLEMTFKLDNGAIIRGKTQKQLLIDMEGPRVVSVEVTPGMTNQSGKRVDIEMTDGNGSGLKEYRVVKVANENDVPICKNLDGYKSIEQDKMTEYLDNGWYYTCVRDNALNDNQDTVAQTKKQVTGVDYSQVNGASLTVENQDENTPMKVKAKIIIPSTEDANKLKMCVSNTGHLKDCSWEAFKSSFDWTFPGHADCNNRTLYVSISDEVGNITNLVNNPYSPHSIAKYDGNGVTLSAADAKKSVCYGGSYSMPNATREGHTLSGWFTAKSGGTKLTTSDKVDYDGVRTYYAQWTVNNYYLDLNGLLDGTSSGNISGFGTADVYIGGKKVSTGVSDYYTQHPYGTTYEIKNIKATTGHTYEGVSSGATSGKVGLGGKNTAVQLKFKTNYYSVSWNGNGGTVTKNGATSVKYNTAVGTLGTATRTGYNFDGWYTAASGGTKIDTNTKVMGNVTYYAHWTAKQFYLDLNGLLDGTSSGNISGYGTADVYIGGKKVATGVSDYYTQHPYGTTYEIKNIKATTGHTYEGVSSGSISGTIGAGEKNTAVQLKFKTNYYSVSWNGNGGTVTKNGATSVKYNTAVGTLGTATRAGYTFKGWFTAASGGTQINTSTKITGNVTFYAQWKIDEPTYKDITSMDIDAGVGLGNNVGIVFKGYTDSGTDGSCKKTVYNRSHVIARVIKVNDQGNVVMGNEIQITSGDTGMGFGDLYAVRLSDSRVLLVGNSAKYSGSNTYITGATAAIVEVNASNMTAKVVGGPSVFGRRACNADAYEVFGLACAGNTCKVPIGTKALGSDRRGHEFDVYVITVSGNSISVYNSGEGGKVAGDPLNRAGRLIHQAPGSSMSILFTLNNGYVMSNTIGFTHGDGNNFSSDMLRTLHIPLSYYPTGYYANVPTSAVRWYNALDVGKYTSIINNELRSYIQNNGITYYPIADFNEFVYKSTGCCDYQHNNSTHTYNYGCSSLPKLAAIGDSSFISIDYEYDRNVREYVNHYKFYTYPENCRNGNTSAACTTPTVKEMNWNFTRESSSKLISLGRCVLELGKQRSGSICY